MHTFGCPSGNTLGITREHVQMLAHIRSTQGSFSTPVLRFFVAVIRCPHTELRFGPVIGRHHHRCGKPGAAVAVVGGALELAKIGQYGRIFLEGAHRTDILFAVTEFTHANIDLPGEGFYVEDHLAPPGLSLDDIKKPATDTVERILGAGGSTRRFRTSGIRHGFPFLYRQLAS